MIHRLKVAVRTLIPAFLLLLALPLTVFAQAPGSKHFPDDRAYPGTPSAHCTANTAPSPNINVHDELFSTLDFATLIWRVSYTGRNFVLNTVCTACTGAAPCTLVYPYEPAGMDQAGSAPGTACTPYAGGSGRTVSQARDVACQTGNAVAVRAAKAFCFNALGKGYTVHVNGGGGSATEGDCDGIGPGFTSVTIQDPPSLGSCGFIITPSASGDGLEFNNVNPGGMIGGRKCYFGGVYTGAAPQTVQTDMLNFFFVQIDPQGQSTGTLTVKLWKKGNPGSTPDDSFTVNVTTDVSTLHNDIAAGFNASSLGTHANVTGPRPGNSAFAVDYAANPIPVVEVSNAGSKLENVEISSSNPAVLISSSTENSPNQVVPVLNPWGVAILVLALLISSLWLVRRRRRIQDF